MNLSWFLRSTVRNLCVVLCFTTLPNLSWPRAEAPQQPNLVPPTLLEREALQAGNPLATYAAMLDHESEYLRSKPLEGFYREARFNFEEFLGFPLSGVKALSLPTYRREPSSVETAIPDFYEAQDALRVIKREAGRTQIVVWGEEHHLPQSRSLYEATLRVLWKRGYRYLAAETFGDAVMSDAFRFPDYKTGFYIQDPIFASALRVAKGLGYKLIAYETMERGPAGDASFRDRRQAENLKARVFDRDPQAKVFIIAGRGHASEVTAKDGWTPMASVLKRLTGIDPFTIYAPTMSQRQTPEEEHPYYRFASRRGLLRKPTIFLSRRDGRPLGSESCDAYVFWPRIEVQEGRPDWMVRELGRKKVEIPEVLRSGQGTRLVQAFVAGEPASAIPIDQVVIDQEGAKRVLMLPRGNFWIRTIDRDSKVLGESRITVH